MPKQVMVFPFTVPVDGAGNMRDPAQGIYARSFARALAERLAGGGGLAATAATLTSHGLPGAPEESPDPKEHGWVVASQAWTLEEALKISLPEGAEFLLHGAAELTDRVRLRLLLVDQPKQSLALDHVVLRPRAELFAALDEAARSVATALGEELPAADWPTADVEAYVAWLRGRDLSAAHEAGVHVAEPQKSFDGYLEAARRDPHFTDAQERLLTLALDFALGGQGPIEAARAACERLLAQDAKAYKANAALAEIDLMQGKPASAAERLVALLAIKDDWWPAFERLGTALLRQHKYAEALPWFERALRERPDDVDALLGRGVAFAELGRLEDAVASWRAAEKAGHQSVGLHQNLARALATLGHAAEARAERAQVRKLTGTDGPLALLRSLWRKWTARPGRDE